jgi:Gpi18-like mannosyltransferase
MKQRSNAILGALGAVWAGLRRVNLPDLLIVMIGLAFAVLVRYPLLEFKSSDFFNSLKPWYVTIRTMGFSAFATDFTTYNPPYLYEIYLIARFLPDTPNLLATKIPSLIGDFIAAYFVYAVVRLKHARGPMGLVAAFAFLLAPTVVLNSAFWGQADILFTAPLIASLYFLMKDRKSLAMIAFGISLAFKLQAIFLAPLLLGLLLKGNISWRHVLLALLMVVAAIIPAAAAGRPIMDLLLVYLFQAQQYQLLQMSAPTVYAWMPDTGLTQRFFTPTGVAFTAALSFALAVFIFRSKVEMTKGMLLRLALLCCLLVPFFLPKMHDRYFYPADVLSIIFAFYFPRFFFVPIVIVLASFFAYQPTLFGAEPVPMSILALGMFTMLVLVARDVIGRLLVSDLQSPAPSAALELEP